MMALKKTLIAPLCAGLIAAAGVAGTTSPASAQRGLPFSNYCGVGSDRTVLFAVDQTEKLDQEDRRRLANGAIELMNRLNYGERVDIHTVRNEPGARGAVFSMCVPGCPENYDPDEGSIWEQRCDRITIDRDKRIFQTRYVEAVRALTFSGEEAPGTELLRTLSNLSYQYQNRDVARLYIFSDMLECRPYDGWCRINSFDADDAETLMDFARETAPTSGAFAGADIIAFGFGRRLGQGTLKEGEAGEKAVLPNDAQLELRKFWNRYFDDVIEAGSFSLFLEYP